uniref:Uncharacterized protein n=1 Tax=Bionectria ochroleuca TaxID=29856 RepID=A0A0B7JZ75_BIOOC
MRSIKLIIAAFILCLWQLVTAHSELSASTTVPVDSTITALPSLATTAAPELELRAGANTCGYIQGNVSQPLTCQDTCGFIRMSWSGNGHAGCCGSNGCQIYTTCLENTSTDDELARICTGSKSACITYTWSTQSYVYYSCAESRTTIPVSMDTSTGTRPPTSVTSGYPSTARSTRTSDGTGAPQPTSSGNDNSPGLGLESDLGAQERMKAAVGSAILGGVLLGSFLLFGCFFNPPGSDGANEEHQASPPPGENAGLLGSGQEMHTPVSTVSHSTVSEGRFYGQQPIYLGSGQEMHTPVATKPEARFYQQQPIIYSPQVEYA